MKVCVVGGGVSGLASAISLANKGHRVVVLERHDSLGGRARCMQTSAGFVFDRGPSWYWMPDVFGRFFAQNGASISDYMDLRRLDPSYSVVWPSGVQDALPANAEALEAYFEQEETGAGEQLRKFLKDARFKYLIGMRALVYRPSLSWTEYLSLPILLGLARRSVLSSMRQHVNRYFTSPKLRQLMEFPTLFLGASPMHTPALYSLMNYADMGLGTWYPMGGMYRLIVALQRLAEKKGVQFALNTQVQYLHIAKDRVVAAETDQGSYSADAVVAAADYWHVEQNWLPPAYRNYSARYWQTRDMAPSALLFYIGLNKKIEALTHHMLFFDTHYNAHMEAIYQKAAWPTHPLFYVCVPSRTDASVAPPGHENLFVLIPIASALSATTDQQDVSERYYQQVMQRISAATNTDIQASVVYKSVYLPRDFSQDYGSLRGNAYGLANTLAQTGPGKPVIRNKRLPNLYYAGQLTVPGPGLPPSLISGQVVAEHLHRHLPD